MNFRFLLTTNGKTEQKVEYQIRDTDQRVRRLNSLKHIPGES